MPFHAICPVADIPLGQHRLVNAGNMKLIVYHVDAGFFATQSNCPHVMAPLAKGRIVEGSQIQCPFHRARFDVRTGECVQWANWPRGIVDVLNVFRGEKNLKTWPVVVRDGQVMVEI
jgi:3-phenylpropionate/trans-cinnamate dioxygenase ferredoxin subunit